MTDVLRVTKETVRLGPVPVQLVRRTRLRQSVGPDRGARRGARAAARIDASRGWLPATARDQPEFCVRIDHEYLAAAALACAQNRNRRAELEAVMMRGWSEGAGGRATNAAGPVVGPDPTAVGPAARAAAHAAADRERLLVLVHDAWCRWEALRIQLLADLSCRDELRLAVRAYYGAALAAHHPQPGLLPSLAGEPGLCLRCAPSDPAVVVVLRGRFATAVAPDLVQVHREGRP